MLNHKTQLIKTEKKKYLDKINNILQKSSFNDKLSWRLIKKKKNQSTNTIPTLSFNNKTITDPTKNLRLHSVLCHPKPPILESRHKAFHTQINKKVQRIQYNNPNKLKLFDILNSPIQYYELTRCIKKLDKDKAYGPDLIHNQMLINGGETLWTQLLDLFNKCLKDGIFPNIWNFANICPIPKPGKIHSDPKNFRPIAVSSCLGRVFEKILATRLQHYCIKNKIFNNNQCGFQINRSTNDILSTFLKDAYDALNKNTFINCVFTDFSKAYDLYMAQRLIYKLFHNINIKGNFLNCIISFIRNLYTRVVTKTGSSSWKLQTQDCLKAPPYHQSFTSYSRMILK